MSLLLEECSVLGVLVPTKAVLYWLILGTCEGSISHGVFMIQQLGIVSKTSQCGTNHSLNPTFTMVLQSWTWYDLFLVAQ